MVCALAFQSDIQIQSQTQVSSFFLLPIVLVEHLHVQHALLFNIGECECVYMYAGLDWVSTGFDGSGNEDEQFGHGSVFQQPPVLYQHICQS